MAVKNILKVYQAILVVAVVIGKSHLARSTACSHLLRWFTCFMQISWALSLAVGNQPFPYIAEQDSIQFLQSFLNLHLWLLVLEAIFKYIFIFSTSISLRRPKLGTILQISKHPLHIANQDIADLGCYLLILDQLLPLFQQHWALSRPTLHLTLYLSELHVQLILCFLQLFYHSKEHHR